MIHPIFDRKAFVFLVTFEHGEELERALLVQVVRRLEAEVAGHEIVRLDTGPEVWHLKQRQSGFLILQLPYLAYKHLA